MKIFELTLQTTDLKETEKFYSKTLGFQITAQSENYISLQTGT